MPWGEEGRDAVVPLGWSLGPASPCPVSSPSARQAWHSPWHGESGGSLHPSAHSQLPSLSWLLFLSSLILVSPWSSSSLSGQGTSRPPLPSWVPSPCLARDAPGEVERALSVTGEDREHRGEAGGGSIPKMGSAGPGSSRDTWRPALALLHPVFAVSFSSSPSNHTDPASGAAPSQARHTHVEVN